MTRRGGDAATRRCKHLLGGLSPRPRVSASPRLYWVADGVYRNLVCALPLQRPEFRLARETVLAYKRKEWHRIDPARLGKHRQAPARQIAPQDGDEGAKIPRL